MAVASHSELRDPYTWDSLATTGTDSIIRYPDRVWSEYQRAWVLPIPNSRMDDKYRGMSNKALSDHQEAIARQMRFTNPTPPIVLRGDGMFINQLQKETDEWLKGIKL